MGGDAPRGDATKAVPAASRTIAILRLLAGNPHPMSLSEIASKLDLIPSTCLHILRVLVAESLVAVDRPTKRYSVGVGILPLARSFLAKDGMAAFLQRKLEELSRQFGVSTVASRLDRDRFIAISMSVPLHVFALNAGLGSRFPVDVSASGRCYAAFGPEDPDAVADRLGKWRWANVPDRATWLAEVEECRKRGYAVDRECYVAGVTVIAAPVFDLAGQLTYALGAVGMTQAIDAIGVARLGNQLIAVGSSAPQA